MNKVTKITMTVGVIILFLLLYVPIEGMRSSGTPIPRFVGLILFVGAIGTIRAIWKVRKDNGDDSDNTSILQK